MLNFILFDDNPIFLKELNNLITKYMMKEDCEYKIHSFTRFDSKMKELIEKDISNKIYFLDIETKDESGLNIFHLIREKHNDWHSLVLFITNHNEYKYEALGNRLNLFDFINKLDNAKESINNALGRIIKTYEQNKKCLKIKKDYSIYKLSFKDIIQITKIKATNKIQIKTTYENIEISSTLKAISSMLNEDFIKLSSSNIINKNQVYKYDKLNNKIVFNNYDETSDISRRFKKDLEKVL